MSEEHGVNAAAEEETSSNSVNRRDILKGIGTAGSAAALTSISAFSVMAKSPRVSTSQEAQNVLESDAVQSLLAALDTPETHPRKAATQESVVDGTSLTTTTTLPTALGTIIYRELENHAVNAQYHFPTGTQSETLPAKYHHIPDNTAPALSASGQQMVFGREATTHELQDLARITNADFDTIRATTSTEFDGFRVVSVDGDTYQIYRVTFNNRPNIRREIDTITAQNTDVIISHSKGDDTMITPSQAGLDPGGPGGGGSGTNWCFQCVLTIGACAACEGVCKDGFDAACASCVVALCGTAVPYACTKCFKKNCWCH